jgi:pilus assembly protein CpaE
MARSPRSGVAAKPAREGILAVTRDHPTLERLEGVIRELQLDDELSISDTPDLALHRIRAGLTPRVLLLDIADLPAPIAEIGAARAVGGADLALVGLGTVNDVALYRDLLGAGANDYLIRPPTRDALAMILQKHPGGAAATGDGGLGQVVVFVGSRGGVGTTTAAVGCAWLLAEDRAEPTALLDLDLHFGTVALKLDTEPGSGLYEALEQPSRIDSLFIDRAMVKVTDNLRVLATEASAAQHLMVDAGAIDMLLYELRRKFPRVVVDLPRGATPVQRVMLAAASHVVVICERSLAGLRDTIRLQTLMREQAPQVRLWLVEAGATGSRALIGKSEFEKGVGKAFDMTISFDPKSAGDAANTGQPLPVAAPRSPVVREFRRLAELVAGPTENVPKRRLFTIRSLW